MGADFVNRVNGGLGGAEVSAAKLQGGSLSEAELALSQLAEVFVQQPGARIGPTIDFKLPYEGKGKISEDSDSPVLNVEAKYRALVEQIPAVVFMAYLDKGIGEAYVSPQIEAALGFSQSEWLEDPVRWYQQVHPDDKARWSVEAAAMFLSGKPLRSAYRVIARDGKVLWFQCEAKMIRRPDGRPWFIHGVGFDITDLKIAEAALEEERKLLSAILDTVGAMVVVLDPDGRIVRFNRLWDETTGLAGVQMEGQVIWDLQPLAEDSEHFRGIFAAAKEGALVHESESLWVRPDGETRCISWACTVLKGPDGSAAHVVVTGVDVTERRKMEQTVLETSAREQRRIGQDLHDDLGQHLTGIAFLSKVMAQRLSERSYVESKEAEKIVRLVNQAIEKTRELAHGLLPVVSEGHGLMSALERWADEARDVCHVDCRFECPSPVLIDDVSVATHLYHIAQEAVNNAIKHGRAQTITIRLAADGASGTLIIDDDGSGYKRGPSKHGGLGLGIMSHRANMMGGSLDIRSLPPQGTRVTCMFPVRAAGFGEVNDADTRPIQSVTAKPNFSH